MNSKIVIGKAPMDTVTCYYFSGEVPGNACLPSDSCNAPSTTACKKRKDNTSIFGSGILGHLEPVADQCFPQPGVGAEECLFCNSGTKMVWLRGCGGGCNQQPDTTEFPPLGCAAPYQPIGGTCQRSLAFQNQCNQNGGTYDDQVTCTCGGCSNCGESPILIDVDHSDFHLTDAANGVYFDMFGDGLPQHWSRTAPGATNAFLVLDRNGNGAVDDGGELFGNLTTQPNPPGGEGRNGFLALAEFDKPANGGNGDGVITSNDAVFANLRLWQDVNHNGISEPSELHTLPELV